MDFEKMLITYFAEWSEEFRQHATNSSYFGVQPFDTTIQYQSTAQRMVNIILTKSKIACDILLMLLWPLRTTNLVYYQSYLLNQIFTQKYIGFIYRYIWDLETV